MNWDGHSNPHKPPISFDDLAQKFLNNPQTFYSIVIGVLVILGLLNSFYTVRTDEEAVVTRWGRYLNTTGPGLHMKVPVMDRVQRVATQATRQEAFGFYLPDTESKSSLNRTRTFGQRRASTLGSRRNLDNESLMLSGDLNVADVEWVVQYRIRDAREYLFNVADPTKNIRDISQAVMRQVVGDRSINEVLTTGKSEIQSAVRQEIQAILDQYRMGIEIQEVQLQSVLPPENVIPSFNEVNAALQEQKQGINEAERLYNKVIPEAKGKKEEQISRALGYAQAVTNRAEGDANKFGQILEEYRKAPEITRTRLYLDLVQDMMARIGSFTVVDPEVRGVLPVFPTDGGSTLNPQNMNRAQLKREPQTR